MTIFRDRRGQVVPKERWVSLVVDTDSRVAIACVVTPEREEIDVVTRWVGVRQVDEMTGIESGPMYWTPIGGGAYDGTCVEHQTFLAALRFHDAAIAALRTGRGLPEP